MRISDTGLAPGKPHKTGIDGLYIRDMELDEFQSFLASLEGSEEDGKPPSSVVWTLFDKVFCDETGSRFEDFPRPEDHERMTVGMLNALPREFREFIEGLGKHRG